MSMIVNPFWFAAAGGGLPSDDFNRADSTTTLGTSSSGHAWTALGGTWGISSNKGYIQDATGVKPPYLESGVSDCTVKAVLNKSDASNNLNRFGIAFRISDASNFIYAYFITSSQARLFKFEAGVGTQIGSATGLTETNGDSLSAVLSGTSIIIKHNTNTIISVTETFNQTATKHGLYWEAGGSAASVCRWDDFLVTVP